MNIKAKIICSIGCFGVLLLVIISISLSAITKSQQGFIEYRGFARDANLVGKVEANLLQARVVAKNYIASGKPSERQKFENDWQQMEQYLAEAEAEIENPERRALMDLVHKEEEAYYQTFEKVAALIETRNEIVHGTMNQIGPEIRKNLTEIMVSAKEDGDSIAAFHAGLAAQYLLLGRLYAVKFLDTNAAEDYEASKGHFDALQEEITTLDKELQNPTRRALLGIVQEGATKYTAEFSRLQGIIKERNTYIKDELDTLGPLMAKNLEATKHSVIYDQDTLGPTLQASLEQSKGVIWAISLLSILVGTAVAFFLYWATVKPIHKLVSIINSVAKGDLTKRITLKQKDEMGQMAGTFNGFIDNLQGILKGIVGQSKELSEGSHSMQATAGEMLNEAMSVNQQANNVSVSGKQLSDNMQSVAENTEEINGAVQTVASAVEEMSASISEVARNCEEESRVADEANVHAQKARKLLKELGIAANEISSVIVVINNIAEQTNLLALNATIEAASAGEAGKGFAVVANEVKELARQSGEAADRISEQIQGVQTRVQNSITSSDKTTDVIGEVSEISHRNAASTEQQSSAVSEIANSIAKVVENLDEISKQIQTSAESAEGVSTSMGGINQAAEEMKQGSEDATVRLKQFANIAQKMDDELAQFKV